MSGHNKKTNKLLLLCSILMCAGSGALITQASAVPSPLEDSESFDLSFDLDFILPISHRDSDEVVVLPSETPAADATDAPQAEASTAPEESQEATETPVPEVSLTPEAAQPVNAKGDQVSEEAARGTWSSENGLWYFMVDGVPHHGWLYDTDGHVYYFDSSTGAMMTGTQEIDGKTYNFDLDGILQAAPDQK